MRQYQPWCERLHLIHCPTEASMLKSIAHDVLLHDESINDPTRVRRASAVGSIPFHSVGQVPGAFGSSIHTLVLPGWADALIGAAATIRHTATTARIHF